MPIFKEKENSRTWGNSSAQRRGFRRGDAGAWIPWVPAASLRLPCISSVKCLNRALFSSKDLGALFFLIFRVSQCLQSFEAGRVHLKKKTKDVFKRASAMLELLLKHIWAGNKAQQQLVLEI